MKRNFTLLFAVICITFFSLSVKGITFNWAISGGGTKTDSPSNVVTDADGNIFTAGTFQYVASFNAIQLTGSPKGSGANYDNNLFITKMSPARTNLWNIYSNVGAVNVSSIAATPTGDLIVVGTMRALVNSPAQTTANIIDAVGNTTLFTGLSSSIVQSFVAKFNPSGVVQWVKELNSCAEKNLAVNTNDVTTDSNGNVYLTGYFTNTVIFPTALAPDTLTSTNSSQAAFIAKFDGANGNEIWCKKSTGGIVSEFYNGLTYSRDGNLYVAGVFRNVTTGNAVVVNLGTPTDPINITPSAGYSLVLIKLNTDGVTNYAQQRDNLSDTRPKDVIVNGSMVYVGGSFRGDGVGGFQFTPSALTSTATYLNGFIAAFNTNNGSDVWQKAVLAPAISEVNAITVGSDENLYALGYHYNALGTAVAAGTVVFGDGNANTLVDATNNMGDIFLAAYNLNTGVTQNVRVVAKGTASETANSMCKFGNNLYLLGKYNSGTLTYENATTSSTAGGFDFFLANYTTIPTELKNPANNKSISLFLDKANHAIIIKNSDAVVAKLINVAGATIKTLVNQGTIENISTQGIATGVYVLKLTDKLGRTSTQRIIIQ